MNQQLTFSGIQFGNTPTREDLEKSLRNNYGGRGLQDVFLLP